MEGIANTRHCAYCLKLCGYPVKLCAGCKKRAYCSKDCQVKDWSSKGDGQRHVKWCRHHECGEEDVDWEVVPIPNKGLGIRAKKLIPAGFRIMVEPLFTSPTAHLGIKELDPEGESLQEKFDFNIFMGPNMGRQDGKGVALRIARVQHACSPNAAVVYDETARVAILYAVKAIQAGHEISKSFYFCCFGLFSELRLPGIDPEWSVQQELNFIKNGVALSRYGINCPAGCFCYDPAMSALVKEGRQLHGTVLDLANNQHKIEEALAAGEKLLDIHRRLNITWAYLGHTYYMLSEVAVAKSELLPRANEYIRSAVELFRKICPYSEMKTKKYEKLMEHPETSPNYLVLDN